MHEKKKKKHSKSQHIYTVWLLMKKGLHKRARLREQVDDWFESTHCLSLEFVWERLLFAVWLQSHQWYSVGPAPFCHNIISPVNHLEKKEISWWNTLWSVEEFPLFIFITLAIRVFKWIHVTKYRYGFIDTQDKFEPNQVKLSDWWGLEYV